MALRSKIQNVTAATVDVTKQACGMVTHRTQQFVGWTLQGLVIGAFAMAKYSLEYIDQLTEEGEEDGSVSGSSSDGSMTGSSGDDDGARRVFLLLVLRRVFFSSHSATTHAR